MNIEKSGSISKDFQKSIQETASTFENDKPYQKFLELSAELEKLGLIKNEPHVWEPLDTIGRRAFEEMREARKESNWF